MRRGQFFQGGAVTQSAISGIDQALWDIQGRRLGVPCWQLFGGQVRDHLRMYDHLGGGDSSVVYGPATVERFGEAAARSVADGFDAVKILAVPMGSALPSREAVRDAARAMDAVRTAVGPDVDVMVDLHGRTTAAGAIVFAEALAEYDPWFLEEPCQPGDLPGMTRVSQSVAVPLAWGERLTELEECRDVLRTGACSLLQPDVCHIGGPTGLRKVAALAEAHHVPLAPHNPLGPLATVVAQHIGFSTPGVLIQEVMRSDVPWRDDLLDGGIPIHRGTSVPSDRPGWGIEIDDAVAARFPYQPEPLLDVRLPDGTVGDW